MELLFKTIGININLMFNNILNYFFVLIIYVEVYYL